MTDTAFQTTGQACYIARPVADSTAEHFGCPGADWQIVGRNGHVFGTFVQTGRVPGKPVRVPGWPTRKGARVRFVPWGFDSSDPATGQEVDGWLGE